MTVRGPTRRRSQAQARRSPGHRRWITPRWDRL